MNPFLFQAARKITDEYSGKFQHICIVLPNRRGALFLRKFLKQMSEGALWMPTIISIEEMVETLSELVCPDSVTLTLQLYECWTSFEKHREEPFQDFIRWSNTVLHDFNEVDRHLVNAADIFKNIREAKHIENWSLGAETLTEFQLRYLAFMDDLGELYERFSAKLLSQGMGWQGLAYRHALKNMEGSSFLSRYEKIIFCGFNALNRAETEMITRLKKAGKAELLWDIDEYYFHDQGQEAGDFLRKNFRNEFLRSPHFIEKNLAASAREIDVVGTPRSMGQAAAAAEKIRQWIGEGIKQESMAVVLGDESLLFPVLSMIPAEVSALNITLEYPLHLTSVYDLYEQILQMQLHAETSRKKTLSFYYKDLYRLFFNPCFHLLLDQEKQDPLQDVLDRIKNFNISFVSLAWLREHAGERFSEIAFLFERWKDGADAVMALKRVNELFRDYYLAIEKRTVNQEIELEFIYSFSRVLNRLDDLVNKKPSINNLRSVYQLLREVVADNTVPFYGEPMAGLQLMGVLETRTLDFENVIILGMNEGILPAGKGGNSFIPWDLKKYFGLPLNSEKDAVYAYHFYRLLQRATKVCLVYNTEPDTFGSGEMSRFITQLELELSAKNPAARISKRIASGVFPTASSAEISIPKDPENLSRLEAKSFPPEGKPGLSPSSLNLYRDCSLKFFLKYIAQVSEEEDVEEDMEAATFGSILHGTLENLYTPFIEKPLRTADLGFSPDAIEREIKKVYESTYQDGGLLKGKNLIAVGIIEMYVRRMLDEDSRLIKMLASKKQELKITGLEKELHYTIEAENNGKRIQVKVSGKCDRLDLAGEFFRIVDYKTSVKQEDNFVFGNFEDLFAGKGNNKLFQLFIYAWLAWRNGLAAPEVLMPCIIPFKNNSGQPERVMADKKTPLVFSEKLLLEFESKLQDFITSMFEAGKPFAQSDDRKYCEYCGYKLICNR